MITLENSRLAKLITDKDDLVTIGRKMSHDIEALERKIAVYEKKEKDITARVNPPKELEDEGNKIVKEIQSLSKKLEKIANEIEQYKLDAIPKEMKEEHLALLKEREKMQREMNKVALKVQKIKDKCIPIIQREVKPLLKEEYDDIETAKVKDGKVVISTFNHLEDWKKKFKR